VLKELGKADWLQTLNIPESRMFAPPAILGAFTAEETHPTAHAVIFGA
jgi:hypothetical protein